MPVELQARPQEPELVFLRLEGFLLVVDSLELQQVPPDLGDQVLLFPGQGLRQRQVAGTRRA